MDVRMVRLQEADLALVMEWRMRPDITKFMNTDPRLTIEGQRRWFSGLQRDDSQIYWVIWLEDTPIGMIYLTDIDQVNQRCSWGYYIAVREKRSLKLALYLEWSLYDYVFDVLGLHKLCNETFVENQPVIRLHQLCGSKQDGIMRQHIYKAGRFYDVAVGSILKEEWAEKKKSIEYEPFPFV